MVSLLLNCMQMMLNCILAVRLRLIILIRSCRLIWIKYVDLGVIMDNKIKFSSHINGIVSKAHKSANLIIRRFMSRDMSSLVRAFTVYVRSILLEYCSVDVDCGIRFF